MLKTFWAVIKNSKIELVDLVNLPEGTKILVTPISNNPNLESSQEWNDIILSSLNKTYDENEPEYSLDLIKEFNPEYEGK